MPFADSFISTETGVVPGFETTKLNSDCLVADIVRNVCECFYTILWTLTKAKVLNLTFNVVK